MVAGTRYVGAAGAMVWMASWWLAACGGATAVEVDGKESGGGPSTGGTSGTGGRPSAGGVSAGPGGKAPVGVGGRAPGAGGRAAGGAAIGGTGSIGGQGGVGIGGSGNVPAGGSAGASTGGGSTSLFATEFDQSCKYDTDCVVVTEGDQCTPHECPNAGISTFAATHWQARAKSISCPEPKPRVPSPECLPVLSACFRKTCRARGAYTMFASNYDQTCEVDSDCVIVQTGEVCDPCGCSFGTVSTKGLDSFLEDQQGQRFCTPPPSTCDCAVPEAACVFRPDQGRSICELR